MTEAAAAQRGCLSRLRQLVCARKQDGHVPLPLELEDGGSVALQQAARTSKCCDKYTPKQKAGGFTLVTIVSATAIALTIHFSGKNNIEGSAQLGEPSLAPTPIINLPPTPITNHAQTFTANTRTTFGGRDCYVVDPSAAMAQAGFSPQDCNQSALEGCFRVPTLATTIIPRVQITNCTLTDPNSGHNATVNYAINAFMVGEMVPNTPVYVPKPPNLHCSEKSIDDATLVDPTGAMKHPIYLFDACDPLSLGVEKITCNDVSLGSKAGTVTITCDKSG